MTPTLQMGGGGGQMSDDVILREKARELIRAGRLPNRRPDCISGGQGLSEQCMLCDAPIRPDEHGLEVEFTQDDGARATKHHFHTRCFFAVELQLHNLEPAERTALFDNQAPPAIAGSTGGRP
jgi:hypothetical protein